MSHLLPADTAAATPVRLLDPEGWKAVQPSLSPAAVAALARAGFAGGLGDLGLVAAEDGGLSVVFFGLGEGPAKAMSLRGLAARLPQGDYRITQAPPSLDAEQMALAWLLGRYRFNRYKGKTDASPVRLAVSGTVNVARVESIADACALARDLVNTPANDMGPESIEAAAAGLADASGAEIRVVHGDDLPGAGYGLVHAVGRAAVPQRAPRFIEMSWGNQDHPLVAIIGKGVAFDSGGLDIKPSSGMRLMKKDMGGAAHALALARMVMDANLPVRLSVLIPAVENAISGDAMRPGDVLTSRAGLTVEVGNTDAEGRLILADALTRAAELSPDLTIDLATLTGAARVALGPEVVPFYTDDDALADDLARASATVEDPIWRMPMWSPYAAGLDSDIADLKNDPDAWVQAGSVAAALFLKRFAPKGPWLHLDIYAWNPRSRPGWPQGAEAQGVRALFALLEARFR